MKRMRLSTASSDGIIIHNATVICIGVRGIGLLFNSRITSTITIAWVLVVIRVILLRGSALAFFRLRLRSRPPGF
jgi:hypothetical protein